MSNEPYSTECLTTEQAVSRVEKMLVEHAGDYWHPGRRHGRTLYNGWGNDDGIGYMDTRPLASLVCALRNAAPRLIHEWRALRAEVDRLLDVLHTDRSGLVNGLAAVKRRAKGSLWIADGRGPYAFDDYDYRREAGWALQAVIDLVDQVTIQSGDLVHAECCGRAPRPPIEVGETPDVGRMREALLKIAGTGRQCSYQHTTLHSGGPISCREVRQEAMDHPDRFGDHYRDRLIAKAEYCDRCIAADALESSDE